METFSALLAICVGNSPVPGEFPVQRPAMRSFDVSLICVWINGWVNNRKTGDLRHYHAHNEVIVMVCLNKLLNQHLNCQWFEVPWFSCAMIVVSFPVKQLSMLFHREWVYFWSGKFFRMSVILLGLWCIKQEIHVHIDFMNLTAFPVLDSWYFVISWLAYFYVITDR